MKNWSNGKSLLKIKRKWNWFRCCGVIVVKALVFVRHFFLCFTFLFNVHDRKLGLITKVTLDYYRCTAPLIAIEYENRDGKFIGHEQLGLFLFYKPHRLSNVNFRFVICYLEFSDSTDCQSHKLSHFNFVIVFYVTLLRRYNECSIYLLHRQESFNLLNFLFT